MGLSGFEIVMGAEMASIKILDVIASLVWFVNIELVGRNEGHLELRRHWPMRHA